MYGVCVYTYTYMVNGDFNAIRIILKFSFLIALMLSDEFLCSSDKSKDVGKIHWLESIVSKKLHVILKKQVGPNKSLPYIGVEKRNQIRLRVKVDVIWKTIYFQGIVFTRRQRTRWLLVFYHFFWSLVVGRERLLEKMFSLFSQRTQYP